MGHIHEKIDFTASVFVVYKDKVLIRKHEKYKLWLAVGGHIELDEDANTAARREVEEEVGLKVTLISPPHHEIFKSENGDHGLKDLIPPFFMNIHQINETHQHHDLIFGALSSSDKVIPENDNDEWLWLSKEDLLSNSEIDAQIKHYATTILYAVIQK